MVGVLPTTSLSTGTWEPSCHVPSSVVPTLGTIFREGFGWRLNAKVQTLPGTTSRGRNKMSQPFGTHSLSSGLVVTPGGHRETMFVLFSLFSLFCSRSPRNLSTAVPGFTTLRPWTSPARSTGAAWWVNEAEV